MDFENNNIEILENQIKIKLTKKDGKSRIFFLSSLILFLLGLFSIILSNIKLDELLTWKLIQETLRMSVLDMILFPALTLLLYFVYSTIIWTLLKNKFIIFPYDVYKIISYAIGFLGTFAYPIYKNGLIAGIFCIFSGLVIMTDGFAYKMYKVNIELDKKISHLKYWSKITKFLYFPYIEDFNLINDKEEYFYFIRVKSRSLIDEKFVRQYEKSGNVYWNLDEKSFYEELKFSNPTKLRFECYLYFERINKDGVELNHIYIPIGVFSEKKELIDFLNLLSENIKLSYKSPPKMSNKINK